MNTNSPTSEGLRERSAKHISESTEVLPSLTDFEYSNSSEQSDAELKCENSTELLEDDDTDEGILIEVFNSIFTPGVNDKVQVVIHSVFAFLLITLLTLFWLSDWNFHAGMLTLTASALWLSITWYSVSNR